MHTSWRGTTRSLHANETPKVVPRNGKFVLRAVSRMNSFTRSEIWLTAEQLDELAEAIAQLRNPQAVCE
jgi:hypothetical protein